MQGFSALSAHHPTGGPCQHPDVTPWGQWQEGTPRDGKGGVQHSFGGTFLQSLSRRQVQGTTEILEQCCQLLLHSANCLALQRLSAPVRTSTICEQNTRGSERRNHYHCMCFGKTQFKHQSGTCNPAQQRCFHSTDFHLW